MKNGIRTIKYDETLCIEAYRFEGVAQSFPNHFHTHYALGLVEHGRHVCSCKNQTHVLGPGSVVVFNPGDSHACIQDAGGAFDYRGLNIGADVMETWAPEIKGEEGLLLFSRNVTDDSETACQLYALHEMILNDAPTLQKEERLVLLLAALEKSCGQAVSGGPPDCREEIEEVCMFLRTHCAEHIGLDLLCRSVGLSRSTLLRAFIRAKGVTPYRYLENVRIEQARKLLRRGMPPLEAALRTGFSDQSHFTNYFSSVTGLTPGAYRDTFLGKTCAEPAAAQGGTKV